MTLIVFTRPERRLPESVLLAEGMGFDVLVAPSLTVTHGREEDYRKARTAISEGRYDVVVFASPTSVEECAEEWGDLPRLMDGLRIVPIGDGTDRELTGLGVPTEDVPGEYSSAGLVEDLPGRYPGRRFLVIHSDKGSDVLVNGLRSSELEVDELIAYSLEKASGDPRYKIIVEAGLDRDVDAFVFTSAMSVASFDDACSGRMPQVTKGSLVAAIGRPTADALTSRGIGVDIVPSKADFKLLLETVYNTLEVKE